MARIFGSLLVTGVLSALLLLMPGSIRPAAGDERVIPGSDSGPLDGLVFEGMFGPPDGTSDRADVLYFSDGRFWSENCVPCGFTPGPYRAWPTPEGMRFEGILTSPDRGRFLYEGVVKEDHVYARLNWRKERWYWTIDKDFRFEGTRVERSAGLSPAGALEVALTAKPDPGTCRP